VGGEDAGEEDQHGSGQQSQRGTRATD